MPLLEGVQNSEYFPHGYILKDIAERLGLYDTFISKGVKKIEGGNKVLYRKARPNDIPRLFLNILLLSRSKLVKGLSSLA